jgi:hypothetical protein
MVHTAHFAAQTSLLVPKCFILILRNYIRIERLAMTDRRLALCLDFAVPPVEKPARVYRFETLKLGPTRAQKATFLPSWRPGPYQIGANFPASNLSCACLDAVL